MDSQHHAAPLEERMLGRMLFFSDAVFAIVLTILVLELRPPSVKETDMWSGLIALQPKFFAFAGTFGMVGLFWAAHMAVTRRLIVFDWVTAWVNLVFLMTNALMPFGAALIGEFGTRGSAWLVFCGLLMTVSLANVMLVLTIMRGRGRLVGGLIGHERVWRFCRALSPALAFGIGIGAGYAGLDLLSFWCWALIPVFLRIADVFAPRKSKPQKAAAPTKASA